MSNNLSRQQDIYHLNIDSLEPLVAIFSNSSAGDNERTVAGVFERTVDRDMLDNGVATTSSKGTKQVELNGLETASSD